MTYRDAIHISTDSHVTEPIEMYGERIDAAYRGRVPRIETVGDWRTLLIEGLGPRKLMPASEREVAIVGDFDAEDRFRDQLRRIVARAVEAERAPRPEERPTVVTGLLPRRTTKRAATG